MIQGRRRRPAGAFGGSARHAVLSASRATSHLLQAPGGCAAVGRLNDLHRFDTVTNEWEAMPTSDAILGRGGPCFAAGGDGNLYVIAGFAGKEMNDIHQFRPNTKTWTQLPSAGLGRPRRTSAGSSSISEQGVGDVLR